MQILALGSTQFRKLLRDDVGDAGDSSDAGC